MIFWALIQWGPKLFVLFLVVFKNFLRFLFILNSGIKWTSYIGILMLGGLFTLHPIGGLFFYFPQRAGLCMNRAGLVSNGGCLFAVSWPFLQFHQDSKFQGRCCHHLNGQCFTWRNVNICPYAILTIAGIEGIVVLCPLTHIHTHTHTLVLNRDIY